jgi:capsular polysaccharide biosynthesis protein
MSPPLLRRPLGRFGLVLSLTLIGGFAGLAYGVQAPPEYTARAYVVTTGDAAVTYAQAYGRVATSGPVLAQAAALLGGDPSGLEKVTASTSPASPVIEVTARSNSATRSATVANAAAQALTTYGADREPALHVGLTVLAPATVPAHPSSSSPWCELVIGTSAGLLAGATAALFTLRRPHVTRPSFDDPAEIEGHLRIWRARYGPRSVTAYRGAAALTEPPDWAASPNPPPANPPSDDPTSASPTELQPTSAEYPKVKPSSIQPAEMQPTEPQVSGQEATEQRKPDTTETRPGPPNEPGGSAGG